MKYNRIVFDHIPKTGGTFLGNYIRRRVPEMLDVKLNKDGVCIDWSGINAKSWVGKKYDEIEDPSFISGHLCLRPSIFTPKDDDFYFTFIRNPIDVFYSDYYYVNRKYQSKPNIWPIDNINDCNYHINLYRRKPFKEYVDWFIDEYKDNKLFYMYSYQDLPMEKYNFIGVQENMHLSLRKLCEMINIEFDSNAVNEKINDNVAFEDYSYRRDEIAIILETQIKLYDNAIEGLDYMQLNKIRDDMLLKEFKQVNIGSDNYSLGNAIIIGNSAVDAILTKPKYRNSIGFEFLNYCSSNKVYHYWPKLRSIINSRVVDENWEVPKRDEMVVHLRLGDGVRVSMDMTINILNNISNIVKERGLNMVTFVSAFHFGENLPVGDHLNSNIEIITYIKKFMIDNNIPYNFRSKSVDEDFVYLTNASVLGITTGCFSLLAGICSYGDVCRLQYGSAVFKRLPPNKFEFLATRLSKWENSKWMKDKKI